MTRISRHAMLMEIAGVVAKRSTCLRLNVGALVVSPTNRIVSIGYNGQAAGEEHCTSPCPEGGCNTIHAEVNALRHAPPLPHGCSLYVTDSPCTGCAEFIKRSYGVAHVYFQTPYRVATGYQTLLDAGISVTRILPSGVLIDMRTNDVISA